MKKSYPGNKEFEILEEIIPEPGELVLTKRGSGAFECCEMDSILRNYRCDTIVVTGVTTQGCVYATAIGGSDKGYDVFVVDDATATWTQEIQDIFMKAGRIYFGVKNTDDIIRAIK